MDRQGYNKEVPITFEVSPDICDSIITDEEWLWQMLLNLLTNACKYTDKGSIKVSFHLVVVKRKEELAADLTQMLQVEVADTGLCMCADV